MLVSNSFPKVKGVEELGEMLKIAGSTLGEISASTAVSYLRYAGTLEIDVENPMVLLTYYIRDLSGYIAICNYLKEEDLIVAVFLHDNGAIERFPIAGGEGIFSHINLSKLGEVFDLEQNKRFSCRRLNDIQKSLDENEIFLSLNS